MWYLLSLIFHSRIAKSESSKIMSIRACTGTRHIPLFATITPGGADNTRDAAGQSCFDRNYP